MIIDLSDVLKCKQIPSLRVVSRNRHYRNSQTIYNKWDERTLVVRPLVFFFPVFRRCRGENTEAIMLIFVLATEWRGAAYG